MNRVHEVAVENGDVDTSELANEEKGPVVDMDVEQVREGLIAAVGGVRRGRPIAARLCQACVDLLDVDGAELSVVFEGEFSRGLGSAGALTQQLNELQFTVGEGPCVEVVNTCLPVRVTDLLGDDGQRWPAFAAEAVKLGVRSVMALPAAVAGFPIGVLMMHCRKPGRWADAVMSGVFLAAELAVMPVLDVLSIDLDVALNDDTSTAWDDMAAVARAEVYQAVGMVIAQSGVSPAEGLVRLRGYAFAHGQSTSEVAYQILECGLRLIDDKRRRENLEKGESDG